MSAKNRYFCNVSQQVLSEVVAGLPPASWDSQRSYVHLNICFSMFVYIGPEKPQWEVAS